MGLYGAVTYFFGRVSRLQTKENGRPKMHTHAHEGSSRVVGDDLAQQACRDVHGHQRRRLAANRLAWCGALVVIVTQKSMGVGVGLHRQPHQQFTQRTHKEARGGRLEYLCGMKGWGGEARTDPLESLSDGCGNGRLFVWGIVVVLASRACLPLLSAYKSARRRAWHGRHSTIKHNTAQHLFQRGAHAKRKGDRRVHLPVDGPPRLLAGHAVRSDHSAPYQDKGQEASFDSGGLCKVPHQSQEGRNI